MSSHQQTQLTTGNRIYLYRLLRDALGTGRQTFITQVDEALDAAGLPARALGFEDSRALLEELGEFSELTVFKGGRVYVTLSAQPEWDEALDAPSDKGPAGKGGKPWKRKRGTRTIKPVRPRTVETDEHDDVVPTPAAAHEVGTEDGCNIESHDGPTAAAVAPLPDEPAIEVERPSEPSTPAELACEPEPQEDATQASTEDEEDAIDSEAEDDAAQVPAYSFTVTFDPDHADAGVKTLASTPSPAPSQAPGTEDAPRETAAPEIDLGAYPQDFVTEVYCPASVMSDLARLLPYGADALGIAGEYFYIACERGTARLGRGRAEFPMRYLHDGSRKTAIVVLRKRAGATPAWTVESVRAEA